jgi:hypothetical protein
VRRIVDPVPLIQQVDRSHPVNLGSDGRVMDGTHRAARAILDGRSPIDAVRSVVQPKPDDRHCSPHDLPDD